VMAYWQNSPPKMGRSLSVGTGSNRYLVMTNQLTPNDITRLVTQLGHAVGRVRLPGIPVAYDMRVVAEDVTPQRAMELIAGCWEQYSNGRNFYPTKLDKIMRYARAMESGQWVYDPESDPICITDGLVTGGRHRLHAVLLSHHTIKANVQYKTKKELP
jgi:hypothetical protein